MSTTDYTTLLAKSTLIEEVIFQKLRATFGFQLIDLHYLQHSKEQNLVATLQALQNKVPIIARGILQSATGAIHLPELLVRSDYLELLAPLPPIYSTLASNTASYVAVFIRNHSFDNLEAAKISCTQQYLKSTDTACDDILTASLTLMELIECTDYLSELQGIELQGGFIATSKDDYSSQSILNRLSFQAVKALSC